MLQTPILRFFLPTGNPLGFSGSDFIALGLAAVMVLLLFLHKPIEQVAQRLATHTIACMGLLSALPVGLRLMLLGSHPVPTPRVSDDFSYLLLGDTLAHFRLANPPHPMHRFFEGVFTLQDAIVEFHLSDWSGPGPGAGSIARQSLDRRRSLRGRASRPVLLDAARVGCARMGACRRHSGGARIRSAQPLDEYLLGRSGFRQLPDAWYSGRSPALPEGSRKDASAIRFFWARASEYKC